MIKTILIFLALTSNAFAFGLLNQMDAGITPSAGACACDTNKVDESDSLTLYSNGLTYSQSFPAPSSGTNVIVRVKTADSYSPPAVATIILDNDRDFSADTFGSNTITVTASETEYCTAITSSTSLELGSTYYFMVRSTVDYGDRFELAINNGEYTSGAACSKGSAGLDHTSGHTCVSGEDLYFEVCIGEGCSCD